MDQVIGGLAALGSAALFALASIFFRRLGERITPVGVNFGKGVIAVLLTAAVLALNGMSAVPVREALLLSISGLLGITLGDTAYFAALNRLGPRRTLVLDALSPVATALLAIAVLGERLDGAECIGIVLTIGGVSWVLRERLEESSEETAVSSYRQAVVWGVLAVACHAVGVVVSKVALDVVPALEASLVRQVAGLAGLGFYAAVTRRLVSSFTPLREPQNLALLLAASFCGTFLGIWFSLVALRLTTASVATTLNSTGPIFILPLVWLIEGERISGRTLVGSTIAVSGVAVLLLG